jgi:hypothetical protein
MCLEKSGKDSKLFKKECILKKTASMDSSNGKNIITFFGIIELLFVTRDPSTLRQSVLSTALYYWLKS